MQLIIKNPHFALFFFYQPENKFSFAVTFPSLLSSKRAETTTMRKNTIAIGILVLAVTGTLLAMVPQKKPALKDVPCQESMEECSKQPSKGVDNMIPETLSGQFFTHSGL